MGEELLTERLTELDAQNAAQYKYHGRRSTGSTSQAYDDLTWGRSAIASREHTFSPSRACIQVKLGFSTVLMEEELHG